MNPSGTKDWFPFHVACKQQNTGRDATNKEEFKVIKQDN